MRAVGVKQVCPRAAAAGRDAAWFWQTLLGIHLCVCIQAVLAAVLIGVVRRGKCTLEHGLFSTGSKFANLTVFLCCQTESPAGGGNSSGDGGEWGTVFIAQRGY